MIILFGPAGAGKSVQGHMLAARMGWRWLSMGQLLRDTHDAGIAEIMLRGDMVPNEISNRLMGDAIKSAGSIDQIILDGWPRLREQAEWLINSSGDHGRSVKLVIVLEVPRDELLKRLEIRGRADDNAASIDNRLQLYRNEMYPVLGYLNDQGIPVVHLDGVGPVGQIHDKIMEELASRSIATL